MANLYLNQLNNMICKANKIDSLKKRSEYIYKLSSYGAFIYYSGYISNSDFNKAFDKIENDPGEDLYRKERNKCIYNLLSNNYMLNEYYYKVLSLYLSFNTSKIENLEINNDIEKDFIAFLKYINLYSLYEELKNKGMISFDSSILDYSICINNHDDSYIVMHENDSVYKYLTLVHEIAHAFENRVLKKKKKFFDSAPTCEIISITFTRIFMKYLEENQVLSAEELRVIRNNFEINYYNFITWSYLITEGIKHDAFDIDDYVINLYIKNNCIERSLTDHNYSLGSLCSFSLYDKWCKSDLIFLKEIYDIIRDIDKMSLDKLINTFSRIELMKVELNKVLVKK